MRTIQSGVHDVLHAVNTFSTHVEKRFQGMENRFDKMDKRFDGMDKRFDGMDKRFDEVEGRVKDIEGLMVTREYLDDKLTDLRGDLVVLMRKEDRKMHYLVEILHEKHVLSDEETKRIFAHEPFAEYA